MAIPAKYQGSCKDCGATHAIGDMIDKNGNESPNKMGETKAHWCKNGTNCQGAMQLQGFSSQSSTGHDLPVSKDPSTTELSKRVFALDETFKKEHSASLNMVLTYINVRETCEAIGIKHPATIGMILNNIVRNSQ